MLKRKALVNYRKATERKSRCKYCIHKKWVEIYTCNGVYLRHDWRCKKIGFDSSRRYGIQNDHICDYYVQKPVTGNEERANAGARQ